MDFGNPDIIMFGLMSAIKTGNVALDMVLCLFVPIIFRRLFQYMQQGSVHVGKFFTFQGREYNRYITYKKKNYNYWDNEMADNKNQILQKAIRLYMGTQLKLKFPAGDISLSSLQQKAEGNSNKSENQAEQLKKFTVNHMPDNDVFIEIQPGFYFRNITRVQEEENKRGGDRQEVRTSTVIKYHFRCTNRSKGRAMVDGFIQKAYDWYVSEMDRQRDIARYMYQPLVAKSLTDNDAKKTYKRYKLSDDKTFDGLFFPEKARLLRLIDNFTQRKGKFAVQGFPYKLGLLLHGPPGTGKTSMVKAIAHHTKRHIISVPLSRIRTNQELMDVMFDQTFQYVGCEDGIKNKHKFSECIFLMEDVDAAGSVVHSRSDGSGPATKLLSTGMRQASMLMEEKYVDGVEGKHAEDRGSKPSPPASSAPKVNFASTKDPVKGKKKSWWEIPDKLDLAGLLNVLDGVVDCPGRILVMTTNHPEKIDPAVVRPGRINLQLFMGYMTPHNAFEMARHYYGGALPATTERLLEKALLDLFVRSPDYKWSPAEVEQLCAEKPTVEDFIETVKKLY